LKKFFIYTLVTVSTMYFALLAIIYFNQRDLLYHPAKELHSFESYKFLNTKEIQLLTADNVRLRAWYKEPDKAGLMVIFLHGNAGNISNRIDKLKALIDHGDGFIIVEWRGFGKSEGVPTKNGLFLDAEAGINFLKQNNYDLTKIIIIGESLGTGVAVEMATRYKFKGVFLLTPYTSIVDRASEIYPYLPVKYLTKDNFVVLDKIDKINQPLLIVHGTADNVVPYEHALKVFQRAKEPKELITYFGSGHNNYDVVDAFNKLHQYFGIVY
jgi:uncharacterized protein